MLIFVDGTHVEVVRAAQHAQAAIVACQEMTTGEGVEVCRGPTRGSRSRRGRGRGRGRGGGGVGGAVEDLCAALEELAERLKCAYCCQNSCGGDRDGGGDDERMPAAHAWSVLSWQPSIFIRFVVPPPLQSHANLASTLRRAHEALLARLTPLARRAVMCMLATENSAHPAEREIFSEAHAVQAALQDAIARADSWRVHNMLVQSAEPRDEALRYAWARRSLGELVDVLVEFQLSSADLEAGHESPLADLLEPLAALTSVCSPTRTVVLLLEAVLHAWPRWSTLQTQWCCAQLPRWILRHASCAPQFRRYLLGFVAPQREHKNENDVDDDHGDGGAVVETLCIVPLMLLMHKALLGVSPHAQAAHQAAPAAHLAEYWGSALCAYVAESLEQTHRRRVAHLFRLSSGSSRHNASLLPAALMCSQAMDDSL